MKYTGKNDGCQRIKEYYELSFAFENGESDDSILEYVYGNIEGLVRTVINTRFKNYTTIIHKPSYRIENIYDAIEIDGEKYWYSINKTWRSVGIIVAEKLDRIIDDNTYKWKEDLVKNTKTTSFKRGEFEFVCVYRPKEDTMYIDVKYAKCENYHRNKVTIDTIEISGPDNDDIDRAIVAWKKMFTKELGNIA